MKSEEKQAAKAIYHQPQVNDYGKVKDLTRTTTHHVTSMNDGASNKT
jgi:hypothetical protein